jgi:DeoR/GlpR family transcriptional regulator of sugar metabolism
VLKEERHRRILERVRDDGRVVAAELGDELEVSGYTIRRDLDELAEAGQLQRVHGGALARSRTARTYSGRRHQERPGKEELAQAAARLFAPGEIALIDGGSTALELVRALPLDHIGTVITHAPPVAAALEHHTEIEVVVVGGTLDRRAMVCTGARTIAQLGEIAADVCFLGVWSLHAEHGVTQDYFEEAQVRKVLVDHADRVVGLASRAKLGTIAPFAVCPATALTHLATDAPADVTAPFAELGLQIVGP